MNVVFLGFNGVWHRLYFDCGIIFWRVDNESPTSFDATEIDAIYPIIEFGRKHDFVGTMCVSYAMNEICLGSQVEFIFSNGRSVIFRNVDDRTTSVIG